MAELDGSKVKIWVLKVQKGDAAPANTAAMQPLCGISSFSEDSTRQTLDTTSFCSNSVKEFLMGLREGSVTMEGFMDPTDAGQLQMGLVDAGDGLAIAQVVIAWTGDPADGTSLFPLSLESISRSASVEGVVTISYSCKVNGAVIAGPVT